jgi:hypothetical protein
MNDEAIRFSALETLRRPHALIGYAKRCVSIPSLAADAKKFDIQDGVR